MSAVVSSPSEADIRPRRRKWPFVLLLAVVLLGGGYVVVTLAAGWKLRNAVAEVDRLDPRWRLEEVEADRADISEAHNAALMAMAVKPLMPKKWPAWEVMTNNPVAVALRDSFTSLEPQRQLSKEQMDALRTEMERASLAVPKARKLADMPEGRYPITYSEDFIGTLLPYAQDAREVAKLMAFDAMLRSQDGDAAAALTSCRAIVNAARSFGDEPFLISQLVRIACRHQAIGSLERILAQGQPAEADLRDVQQLVEKEEPEPLLLIGLRGERAGGARCLAHIEAQGLLARRKIVLGLIGNESRDSQFTLMAVLPLLSTAGLEWQRAAHLRFLTQFVEAAKLPHERQQAEMERLEKSAKDQPLLVRLIVPAVSKIMVSCRRSRVQLRCAAVALAAERYRLDKKKWPDKLETLHAAGYLHEMPIDLFDDQPLRMRRMEDGLLIYSVGPDGQDNGGHIDRGKPFLKDTDMGFRLWDADKRRQPAAPRKPAKDAAGVPLGRI
jgi:hypothetical protein